MAKALVITKIEGANSTRTETKIVDNTVDAITRAKQANMFWAVPGDTITHEVY